MKTLVDKKFVAEQSVGEITSTPSLLAKPSELATLSRKSETSTDLNYPPLIMYVAAKTGRLPSEIANAQIEANNFNYGTKTPLIIVKDPKLLLSRACGIFFKRKPKNIFAVTGTNGKSSVADFFHQILNICPTFCYH